MKMMFCASLILLWAVGIVVSDDASSSSASSEEYFNEFSVCANSQYVVKGISLLCDSPGTYYYGSGKYRNSEKCMAGDKVKLEIEFYVVQPGEEGATPSNALVDVLIKGYGSVPDYELHNNEDVCSLSTLQTENGGYYQCPSGGSIESGSYYIRSHFYLGEQEESDSYSYNFVPHVVIGFSSNEEVGYYDLGGANTDSCEGKSFLAWTNKIGRKSETLQTFLLVFGLLSFTIVAVGMMGYYIVKQARDVVAASVKEELLDHDNEAHKMALVGQNRDLVKY